MSSLTQQANYKTALQFAGLRFEVFIAPKGVASIPSKFAVQSGPKKGDLAALPAGFASVGLLDKKSNPKLATALNTTPVESYGFQSATRIIRKDRDTSVDFGMQQTDVTSIGLYWGQNFLGTQADPNTGEVNLVISETAFNQEYVAVLIAEDGDAGAEIYTIWDGGRASLEKSGDLAMNDDGIFVRPATLKFLYDPQLDYAIRESYCGLGYKPLAAQAGFGAPVTAITVTPATATLTAGGTQALTVKDSNNTTVTTQATYTSSAPSKATVSSTGVVTAVATGSATITASYSGFTATSAITVS